MSTPRPNRRRQVILDRSLQLGLTTRLAVVTASVFLLCFLLAVFMPAVAALVAGDPVLGVQESLARLGGVWSLLILPLAASMLGLLGLGVVEIFRIAGPCYRIRQVFGDLSRGRLQDSIRVRERDHLKDTVQCLDGALKRLHGDFSVLRHHVESACRSLEALPGSPDSLREDLDQIRQVVEGFELIECGAPKSDDPGPDGDREARDGTETGADAPAPVEPVSAAEPTVAGRP